MSRLTCYLLVVVSVEHLLELVLSEKSVRIQALQIDSVNETKSISADNKKNKKKTGQPRNFSVNYLLLVLKSNHNYEFSILIEKNAGRHVFITGILTLSFHLKDERADVHSAKYFYLFDPLSPHHCLPGPHRGQGWTSRRFSLWHPDPAKHLILSIYSLNE